MVGYGQSEDLIVVTGRHVPAWEIVLRDSGPIVVGIALIVGLLMPATRRALFATPLATMLLAFAALYLCLPGALDWAEDRAASAASDSAWREVDWHALGTLIVGELRIFELSLLVFVVAQLRALVSGGRKAAQPFGDVESLAPPRPMHWRFPLTLSSARSFWRQRAKIVADVNEAPALLQNPEFNPLGFAVRGVALAGLPTAALSLLAGIGNVLDAPAQSSDMEALALQAVMVVLDVVKSYTLPVSLLAAATLAAWTIAGFAQSRVRPTRQLFLTIDAARGFWPLTLATLAAAAGYPSIDDLRDGLENTAELLVDWADTEWLSDWFETSQAYGLALSWLPAIIVVLLTGGTIWLAVVRLAVVPAAVAKIAGPAVAGSPLGAVLRHAFFLVVLPLAAVIAIGWILAR